VNGPSVTYMFYPAAGVNAVLPGPVALQGSAFTSAVKGPGLCFYQCCQWTGAVLQGSAVKGPGLCCRAVPSVDRGCQWTLCDTLSPSHQRAEKMPPAVVHGPVVLQGSAVKGAGLSIDPLLFTCYTLASARGEERCRPQCCTGLSCLANLVTTLS